MALALRVSLMCPSPTIANHDVDVFPRGGELTSISVAFLSTRMLGKGRAGDDRNEKHANPHL